MLPPTLDIEQRSCSRANHHTLLIIVDKIFPQNSIVDINIEKKVVHEITFLTHNLSKMFLIGQFNFIYCYWKNMTFEEYYPLKVI